MTTIAIDTHAAERERLIRTTTTTFLSVWETHTTDLRTLLTQLIEHMSLGDEMFSDSLDHSIDWLGTSRDSPAPLLFDYHVRFPCALPISNFQARRTQLKQEAIKYQKVILLSNHINSVDEENKSFSLDQSRLPSSTVQYCWWSREERSLIMLWRGRITTKDQGQKRFVRMSELSRNIIEKALRWSIAVII